MTHHPHLHMIVPGGGISLDGERLKRRDGASDCLFDISIIYLLSVRSHVVRGAVGIFGFAVADAVDAVDAVDRGPIPRP